MITQTRITCMKFTTFTKIDKDVSYVEKLVLEAAYKNGMSLDEKNPDIVFVLGGDGTFLRAVHQYMDIIDNVKFVGIRCGTLGFFYQFEVGDIKQIFDLIKKGNYKDEVHRLIECRLNKKTIYALNEIRFENPFHTLVCKVSLNGEELETFHGNGLLVCNELGSSAYNKSIGGSVMSHDLDLLQLTEISTIQNNSFRSLGSPIVLRPDATITFSGDFYNVIVGYDHLTCNPNGASDIVVTGSEKKIHMLHDPEYSQLINLKRSFIK